jgi:uracil-DNA glycosylase family 4
MSAGDSIRGELEFFRDLGVTDLFVEAPAAPASLLPGTIRDLAALEKFLGGCPRCKLAKSRTNIVFGQGNPRADLMFVGEAPGRDEDEQGLAFVGRAGQLLTKIIEAIGRKREDVWIGNVLKCRPPENRNPERDEVEACRPFLEEQIRLISPKVIVTLGRSCSARTSRSAGFAAAGRPATAFASCRPSTPPSCSVPPSARRTSGRT